MTISEQYLSELLGPSVFKTPFAANPFGPQELIDEYDGFRFYTTDKTIDNYTSAMIKQPQFSSMETIFLDFIKKRKIVPVFSNSPFIQIAAKFIPLLLKKDNYIAIYSPKKDRILLVLEKMYDTFHNVNDKRAASITVHEMMHMAFKYDPKAYQSVIHNVLSVFYDTFLNNVFTNNGQWASFIDLSDAWKTFYKIEVKRKSGLLTIREYAETLVDLFISIGKRYTYMEGKKEMHYSFDEIKSISYFLIDFGYYTMMGNWSNVSSYLNANNKSLKRWFNNAYESIGCKNILYNSTPCQEMYLCSEVIAMWSELNPQPDKIAKLLSLIK